MQKLTRVLGVFALGFAFALGAAAEQSPASLLLDAIAQAAKFGAADTATVSIPTTGEVEIGFSPGGGAEELVLKTINSSRSEIRMLAYSFTSPTVVAALLSAKRRGVDIKLVADHKHNIELRSSAKARAALSALANAGVHVRTNSTFRAHHDKLVISDRRHVQTGSYNYSGAAARSNSENVIVLWNNPQAAKTYLAHWARNWRSGRDLQLQY